MSPETDSEALRRAAFNLREYASRRREFTSQWGAREQAIVELAIRVEGIAYELSKREGAAEL